MGTPYIPPKIGKEKDPTKSNKTEDNKRAGVREIQRTKNEKAGKYSADIKR